MSRLFSQSSVSDSPAGGSPGGLGLEKGTRRRGLELWPGPSSSLLSGLEGPLDRLSPHGPPGRHRPLVPAPAWPGPKADTSPGCSGSVGNREQASERAGGPGGEQRDGEGRGGDQSRPEKGACPSRSLSLSPLSSGLRTPGNKPRSSPATGCPNAGSGSARRGSLGPPGPRPLSLVPTPCSGLSLLPSSPQVRAHPGPAL